MNIFFLGSAILVFSQLLIFSPPLQALQVNSLAFKDDFTPNQRKEVIINLINDGDVPENIDLKICDYGCNHNGEHFFEEPGEMKRSNASWITLNQEHVILAPREQRNITYTIQAPNNKNLNGSFWSTLLIEPADPIQQPAQSDRGFNLMVKIRYAHQIITNIGKGISKLKILNKSMVNIEGKKYFAVDVSNIGDFFLSPKLTMKLYNPHGNLENSIEVSSERLYPENSQRYLAPIDDIKSGKYTAFLLLDNGDHNLFGDTFLIEFP